MTPVQKTAIVNLFKSSKELKDCVTLAVGDGANDVGMIQASDMSITALATTCVRGG